MNRHNVNNVFKVLLDEVIRGACKQIRGDRYCYINDQDLANFFGVSQSKFSRVINMRSNLSTVEFLRWAELAKVKITIVA